MKHLLLCFLQQGDKVLSASKLDTQEALDWPFYERI